MGRTFLLLGGCVSPGGSAKDRNRKDLSWPTDLGVTYKLYNQRACDFTTIFHDGSLVSSMVWWAPPSPSLTPLLCRKRITVSPETARHRHFPRPMARPKNTALFPSANPHRWHVAQHFPFVDFNPLDQYHHVQFCHFQLLPIDFQHQPGGWIRHLGHLCH